MQRNHNACPLKLRIINSQNITNNFDNNPHNFIINWSTLNIKKIALVINLCLTLALYISLHTFLWLKISDKQKLWWKWPLNFIYETSSRHSSRSQDDIWLLFSKIGAVSFNAVNHAWCGKPTCSGLHQGQHTQVVNGNSAEPFNHKNLTVPSEVCFCIWKMHKNIFL